MAQFKVVIKNFKDKQYQHVIGTMSERRAERVVAGALRNLNTEEYYIDEEEVKE